MLLLNDAVCAPDSSLRFGMTKKYQNGKKKGQTNKSLSLIFIEM